ncbi:nucleoside hydrolase [Streptomyces sp. BE147]|uniref:nucleoside hydrolase n=1 Tax=Streptomyces sp. BE147 TaxID=3002524 RepID=UPI002E79EEFE|nr:nucleoside hydrolase [Streptomyces sp. BE147]MEE1735291.1 nucleoside hydrolase [Streptomyces sp. BE147]
MTTSQALLVDCDTGVDDALALLYLALSPDVDLRAVTTVGGNTDARQAAVNTLQVLELVGRTDIPVAPGADRTLRGSLPHYATHVHGDNGIGNVRLPSPAASPVTVDAVDLIIETARQAEGELSLLATAPLTNLALALRREPRLPEMIRHVTVMGGAVHHPGNITPLAEANIGNDPEAAALVLEAGWDLTIVPLDVTMRENLTTATQRDLLAHGSAASVFAARVLDVYFDFHEEVALPYRGSACHDPLAAAIAVGHVTPLLAPRLHVGVETGDGPARGALVADTRGMYLSYPERADANARVVLETDGRFPERLVERIRTGGSAAA